jgi:hypothetical protein
MESFDWVKARATCSLKSVFVWLEEVLRSDVKSASAITPTPQHVRFELKRPADDKIVVQRITALAGIDDVAAIVFELSHNAIKVY